MLTVAQQPLKAGGLSGTYIVGTGQPAPFNTLTNAVARLNADGVAGPVTFLLNNSDFNSANGELFPIKIIQFAGTSKTNTVTIKPNTGKNVTISGTNQNGYTGVPAILQIDGADNIIINGSNTTDGNSRNLTIKNSDNVGYAPRTMIWISSNGLNGAQNIHISNTKLQMLNRNNAGLQLSGIFSGSNSIEGSNGVAGTPATAANSNLNIISNEFINVRQGIVIKSSPTSALQSSNIIFSFNKIGATLDSEKPSVPIDFSNAKDFKITDNQIIGIANTSNADSQMGIIISDASNWSFKKNTVKDIKTTGLYAGQALWIKGLQTNGTISENQIFNIKNAVTGLMYAVHLDLTPESTGMLLANNFIGDVASNGTTTQTGHGIYVTNGTGTRIYHNTVAMNAQQSGQSAALYLAGGTGFDIRNNILTNTSSNGLRYAIYSSVGSTAYSQINNNNYFSSPIGSLGGDQVTLAMWKSATGKDGNSKNTNPSFVSPTDLHLQPIEGNAGLNNSGADLLAAVPIDIDGQARTITPDIGADEFSIAKTLAPQPTDQSTGLNFTNVTATGFKINWTNGPGTNRIVVIRSGSAINSAPVNGIGYTANPVFGSGSQIESGNYVIYNGNANTVTVAGLSAATTYHVSIYEYNGADATANYLTAGPLSSSQLTLNAALGWQINNINTLNTISFDATVVGVNVDQFIGNGIAPAPISGQLNSNSWAGNGFEDGEIAFGGINTNPGFGRGTSNGGISKGGLYAFKTSANNAALGIQPTAKDFTPGTVTLRFQNQTENPITSISLGYKVYIYNDQQSSNSLNFSHSANNTTFTAIPQLDVISPSTADVSPSWKASYRVATITGLNIPANGFYYLKWSGDVIGTGNTYDEFALDDIVLSANPTTTFASFQGTAENLSVHGNTSLSGNLTVNGDLKFTSGKLSINANTLTVGGTIINTIAGGIKGGATSNLTIVGDGNKTLSFDQTTAGSTNLFNNFSIPFAAGANNTVKIANDVQINASLNVGLDQKLDLGTNQLKGNLSTITINGTLLTQNDSTTPFPAGKTWTGTGILNLNAELVPQTLVAGTFTNLTLSSPKGTIANVDVTVNGTLYLPSANPSATAGSLSMTNPFVLSMGPDAINTGLGDVSGIIARNTILPNVVYTFGHPNSSILFTTAGTLPDWMKVKVVIGKNDWRLGAIKRYYDITQSKAANTKAIIRQHYLESELNSNIESKLVNWGQMIPTLTFFEQGRSNINTSENWVEITNANLGTYFEDTFDKVYITLDQTEALVLTWNGEVSNSWTTTGNWTSNNGTKTATPSLDTKVIIPNVSPKPQPTLNPITQVLSVEIEKDAVVNSTPNDVFEIYGTSGAWENNGGTFNPPTGNGKVIFKTLDATISGTTIFNNLEIASSGSLRTLDGNKMTIGGTFTNNGLLLAGLNPNTIEYSGIGQSVIYANGSSFKSYFNLVISGSNADFPTNINIRGDFTLNAPVIFTNKTISLIGDIDQKLAVSNSINLNNLIIDKPSGAVLLQKRTAVNGTLNLTKGRVILGANDLILGSSEVAGGPFDVNTMIVADGSGFVRRPYTSVGSYLFPIGELISNPAYSPITVDITSGSFAENSFVAVSVVDGIHPNNNSSQNYISRYWNVKQTGISGTVAKITATYVTPELLVPAETMIAAQLSGTFNAKTNPWVRFSPLTGLNLTATGASLAEGQVSVFTGIKGGDFKVEIAGGDTSCQEELRTLTAAVMGGDMQYTYLWSTVSEPNLGTESTLTPEKFIGTKEYTVTVTDANGRKTTATKTVTAVANAIAGTLSGNQTVCFSYQPNTITLSGNSANVIYWQRSTEPLFLNARIITNTTSTLNGAEAGQITGLTYFRAAIDNGSCGAVFTAPITVSTKTTVWDGQSWSDGSPNVITAAVIAGDYNIKEDIIACSLTVIDSNVTIPAGINVIIDGALIVDNATFKLESNTNLVQKTDALNYGSITVERESSKLYRLDYTMWGSPVTGTQTLKQFSPLTFSNRFYIYNTSTDLFNAIVPTTNGFISGQGYLIRMADNHPDYYSAEIPATSWTGIFSGVPNNGSLSIPLDARKNGYNMISNPYASIIDANQFLTDNETEIEGTLYFWRRRNAVPKGTEGTSAYYATYTSAGGTGVGSASDTSVEPTGFIQVGQGFIVKKATTAPQTGKVLFTNAMRKNINKPDQFFRNANISGRSRIWLNVSNVAGEFGQTLVAYMPHGENGVDRADGKYMGDGSTALTSWLDDAEYIIQGRAPFHASDVVPLNFKSSTAGNYTITIDHVDGLFLGDQNIYLRDNDIGITHNLKIGAYNFATTAGNFNSRFMLVYENGTLVVDNPVFDSNSVVLYKKEGNLIVKSKGISLKEIEIFDLAGRLIKTVTNIRSNEVTIKMNTVNQVLIVKITSTDGIVISKKIIN